MFKLIRLNPPFKQNFTCKHNRFSTSNDNQNNNQNVTPNDNPEMISYQKILKDKYKKYDEKYSQFTKDVESILNEFDKKKYNKIKIKYVFGGIGCLFLFMSWRTIKSYISNQTSDVAIQTMNDDDFQKNVDRLVKKSLIDIMNDKDTMKILNDIVSSIVLSEQTKTDVHKLVDDIVKDQLTNEINKKLLSDVIYESTNSTYKKVKNDAYNKIKFW
jgi:hypothetical protein